MKPSVNYRIYSIDLLRGLVMVVMALDHTRDFFHYDAFLHDPLEIQTTTPWLYFTRWITHFCAPTFVFLSGISIYLQQLRKSNEELGAFLLKRGLWLVVVEVFIIGFAWTFEWSFNAVVLQVIWVIAAGMMAMSLLIRLPVKAIFIVGLIIVVGHNIFDYITSTHSGIVWDLLRNGNFAYHPIGEHFQLVIIYPIVPWLGLMMMGYSLGVIYKPEFDAMRRRKILFQMGLGLIGFFLLLRFMNIYGNPVQWSTQASIWQTILSFLNVNKYPPSLLFICMTIGPGLIFLALFETVNNRLTKVISEFGQVPFFYYVLHFYLIHILCGILFVMRGHSWTETTPDIFGLPFRFVIAGEGYSLTVVYFIWLGVVVALYPLCLWFSRLKKRRKDWWLSYL